ncbi:MAG: very short patch repair endonuclease [Acidobacteriaceae bacterium]
MADKLSAEARSRIMRAIRNKNTKPELIIRKSLFALGYRYRLHSKHLPGKPDLSFPSRKKVIFVHGCFWHQHAIMSCPIRVVPSSNTQYWGPKLLRNVVRDREHAAALRTLGWKVLVIWECELRQNERKALCKIEKFLGSAGI